MKKQLLKVLMLVLAIGAGTLSVMAQINWASLGEAPAANGQFYIYSPYGNCFLKNNGSSNATITTSPADADGKFITTNNTNVQFTLRYSNQNRSITYTYNSTSQKYVLKYSNTRLYISSQGALTSINSSSYDSYDQLGWIFIPVDVFDAQKTTLYYTANAAYASASQSDWGTIKVSANNSTWVDVVDKSEGEQTFGSTATVYFKATAASDMYRFMGWKTSPEAEDYVSTNATYAATFAASTDAANPTAYVLYADFQKKTTIYAKALTGTNNPSVGSAKVAFSSTIPNNQTEATASYSLYGDSYEFTAYFEATAPTGDYEFAGWSRNASGTRMIGGAVNLTYNETFEATGLKETRPTTLEVYAIYIPESANEAQAIHVTDEGEEIITPKPTLAEAISVAEAGDKVQLLKNVSLASTLAIGKDLTLDLNGYSITGATALLNITAGKVTITDGNQRENNAIRLTAASASALSAVTVSGGDLTFHQGLIAAANSGAGAVSGVLVNSGSFLAQGNITIQVNAASGYGVQIAGGEATLYSGSINANGGALGVLASAKTAITNSIKINVSGATNIIGVRTTGSANVTIDGGLISATATGANAYAIQAQAGTVVCEGNMEAKANATSGAYALKQEGSTKVTVNTGRFWTNNTQDIVGNPANNTNLKLGGGYYVHNAALTTYKASDKVGISDLTNPKKFKDAGYKYILSDGENPNYVAFKANNINFSTLEDALDYANQNSGTPMTILQIVADYTFDVPGNYTLPANATLLIPYQGQTAAKTEIERINSTGGSAPSVAYKLTFADGVSLNALGVIELGGKQMSGAQGSTGAGVPRDTYGLLVLEEGSHITLSGSSAILRAWGFVIGEGTIDVRRGAKVREQFQMFDWKGGTYSKNMLSGDNKSTYKVFPVSQYFIQNVEVPTTYHPGSQLNSSTSVYIDYKLGTLSVTSNVINVIGTSGSMFLMDDEIEDENTWVRKWYDVENDLQVYDVNSSASLGSMSINFDNLSTIIKTLVGINNFSSTDYTLPVTNNMKIHLLSGNMNITQSTVMLPGSQIEIDKEATVTINSGKTLYLHDSDQWGKYTFNSAWAQRIAYRPIATPTNTQRNISSAAALGDATMNVHGTFEVKGNIYTTANGANIFSSIKDAGTVQFLTNAGGGGNLYQWKTDGYASYPCTSAQLKNGEMVGETHNYSSTYGAYTPTAGTTATAANPKSFCFLDMDGDEIGEWVSLDVEDCFVKDNGGNYYAKPQEYVRLLNGKTENTAVGKEHTYSYRTQDDTLLICMPDCQWWKVVPVEESDSLFYCPTNNVYYYYDDSNANSQNWAWKEKRFTIKWNNWDGSTLSTYQQVYKSIPSYQGTTPQRGMTTYYTYAFKGWLPEIMPVTKNETYTAQFEERDRKYTITFLDEDGTSIIETQQCKIGEVPVCYNMPFKEGMRLEWLPYEPIAVSGAATYRAHFTEEEKTAYTITFFDYNGTVLQSGEVAVGEMPVYDEANGIPSKPSIAGTDYEWSGWTPEIVAVEANASYSATFRAVAAKYDIKFYQQDGTTQIGETQHVPYGELPAVPDVSDLAPDDAPEGHYYEVVWNPGISVAVKNQDYTIQRFDLKRGKCSFTMIAGENGKVQYEDEEPTDMVNVVDDYGTEVTIEAKPNAYYRFVRWSDGNTTAKREDYKLSSTTLRAEFALAQYTIIWKDHAGETLGSTIVTHGETPSYAAPARDADMVNSYSFAGWKTAIDGSGTGIVAATAPATYFATYNTTPVQYTLRFIFDNGREDFVKDYGYNAEPVITNPTKTSLMGVEFVFTGWKNNATDAITEAGTGTTTLPAVTGNASYTAQYRGELEAGGTVAENIVLDDPTSLDDLIIHTNGSVEAYGGVALTANNLYLEATMSKSGQLLGTNVSAVKAYFDLTLDTDRRHWHAFGVPWNVDVATDPIVEIKNRVGEDCSRTLIIGRDYDIVYYDGAKRASQGAGAHCWNYLKHYSEGGQPVETMTPGKGYMITFTSEVGTIRLTKATGAPIIFSDAFSVAPNNGGATEDNGWNAIANPMPYHATLDAGPTVGYVHDGGEIGSDGYTAYDIEDKKFIVGKMVYVQVTSTSDQSVTVLPAGTAGDFTVVAAPKRRAQAKATDKRYLSLRDYYTVSLTNANGVGSKVYVLPEEDKADEYVIGHDLSQFSMSDKKAQIWVNRYNTQLALNTTAPVNGVAEFPISVYAPQAGEYTLALQSQPEEGYTVYLTQNGEAIWNLCSSAYAVTLNNGTNKTFGLRITQSNAPAVVTGIDEAIVDAQGQTRKVLINDKVYIIRGEKVYSVDGQLVK